MKRCSKCGVEKDECEFYKSKKSKGGLRADCKSCNKEANRKWREANPEANRRWQKANPDKVREHARRCYEANLEKVRERKRRWYEANSDKVRERTRRWHEANPERCYIHSARRSLKHTSGLTEVPEELVNAVVELRQIKRQIKQLNNVITEKLK